MHKEIYAIYGASGYGREVMPLARSQLVRQGIDQEQLFFIDDDPASDCCNGHRILRYSDFMQIPASERYVAIAIANSSVRQKLADSCRRDGVRPWDVVADNVCTLDDVIIGEGSILSPFVTLTSSIRIGCHFQANIYSYVAHDCVIGDYVTFAPGAKCNGNVHVHDHAYIGTGAIIKQGSHGKPLVIGQGAIVGMGAVVTKDVGAGAIVVGNPARPMEQKTC